MVGGKAKEYRAGEEEIETMSLAKVGLVMVRAADVAGGVAGNR